jgi:hypothetical protein
MTIPRLNVNTALAVADGQTISGYIVKHDGAYYSYGADHALIGEYSSQIEASRSIPSPTVHRDKPRARRRTRAREHYRR